MTLSILQTQFSRGLITPTMGELPEGINQSYPPDEQQARFAVYRNNVFKSLQGVLEGVYPKVKQVVGEPFFNQLANAFISQHPPEHAALVGFGRGLDDFIRAFKSAESLPYLADLAHYEWLCHNAYYAADAVSLNASDFAKWDNKLLASANVILHPSTALLNSDYAIYSLSRYLESEHDEQDNINIGEPENILIVRPQHDVSTIPLDAGNFSFFQALTQNINITEALTLASEQHSSFEPASAFALLIGSESVIDIIGEPST